MTDESAAVQIDINVFVVCMFFLEWLVMVYSLQ